MEQEKMNKEEEKGTRGKIREKEIQDFIDSITDDNICNRIKKNSINNSKSINVNGERITCISLDLESLEGIFDKAMSYDVILRYLAERIIETDTPEFIKRSTTYIAMDFVKNKEMNTSALGAFGGLIKKVFFDILRNPDKY